MKKMVFMFVLLLLTSFLTFGFLGASDVEKHNFSVHDMLAMERISSVEVSPDGKLLAFSKSVINVEENKSNYDIFLLDSKGGKLKEFVNSKSADFNPVWAKDQKSLYFLSSRSGKVQVWQKFLSGKLVQITDLPLSVDNLKISEDNKYIAFTMEVFPGKTLEETVKILEEKKKSKATGMVFDKLFIRHWDTWNDGRRRHIFVMNLKTKDCKDIMKMMDADSPIKPFGGSEEFNFAPCKKNIVFTARNSGRDEAWSTNYDIYVAPIDGSKEPKSLTGQNKAWDTTPVFSPDGKSFAYLAMKRAGFEADRFGIMLFDLKTKKVREIAPKWDRSASSILWDKNGKTIYVTASNLGQKSIFAINVKSGKAKVLVKEGSCSSVSLSGKDLIFTMSNLKSPKEIFRVDKRGKKIKQISHVNTQKLQKANMGDYEQFVFKGWNNEDVHCYVVKPANFDAKKKYPVAFLIHGGPQGSFGNNFHYRWNPQAYAGAGYAVVMVDFHGSVGYGQKFTDSISGDWGGKPLEDLKKGLAAATKKYPWMDKDKVAGLGASYGGYMINWIQGNWSDRFSCLVCHDGNLDERMAYYDTEELWFPEWENGGTPWEKPEAYKEHNPIEYVKNWKTPMLVIHGGRDYRVVATQGISTFTALQRKNIPSKLLYFPDENHWVLKPQNSILWHNTVIDWLNQWTKKK